MHPVQPGKNIKEAAPRIAGHKNSLREQLPPGQHLARHKQDAQPRRDVPQRAKATQIAASQPSPRELQRGAAGQQNERVHPKNRWNAHRDPIVRTAPHDKRAGQRHEKHQYRKDGQRDPGVVTPWRRLRRPPLLSAAVVATAAECRWLVPSATAANILNDEFYFVIDRCAGHAALLSFISVSPGSAPLSAWAPQIAE